MRILIIGINYAPEVTGIAPYTTGLAEGLAARGHQVTVYTGMPHYPEWRIADDYVYSTGSLEMPNGIHLRRFPHYVPADTSLVNRLRMESSFGRRVTRAYWGRPDLIIAATPALAATAMVVARARTQRIPVGVIVFDLYGLGVAEATSAGGATAALAMNFESNVLRQANGVAVIHERFRRSVVDMGVAESDVTVIRNWSHVEQPTPRSPELIDTIRQRFGWGADETVVVHSGNMGVKQGLINVVDAARIAEERNLPVRFVLIGEGNQRAELEQLGTGLRRLQFIRTLPSNEFGDALAAADLLLVNELPGVSGMAVPSKLTSYFTAGRPVLAAVDPDGVTADEVRRSGAGVIVAAGDPGALAATAVDLAADHAHCRELAANGPAYAERELGAAAAIDEYERWGMRLAARPLVAEQVS